MRNWRADFRRSERVSRTGLPVDFMNKPPSHTDNKQARKIANKGEYGINNPRYLMQ